MKLFRNCLLAYGLFAAAGVSALTQDEEIFIHGNVEFILFHELAHIIINDLEVPVFGPEELAADYLATIALINPLEINVANADRARQYLSAVAKGFSTTWDLKEPQINQLPFWDTHGLTIQRYYNIGCLLYGSNPGAFPRIPSLTGMPKERASQCNMEYEKARKSALWLLDHYGKKRPEDNTDISITYTLPETEIARQVQVSIKKSRLIENIIARFNDRFALENKIAIQIKKCQVRQAVWDENNRELVICHELFDYFYSLARISESHNLNQSVKSLD